MLLNDSYAFEKNRKILSGYRTSQIEYLKRRYPKATLEQIEAFVNKVIKDEMVSPMVTFREYAEEGRPVVKELPLHKFWSSVVGNNIFTPSGTVYCRPEVRESRLRISIRTGIENRNKFKKIYLSAREAGNTREEEFYDNKQQAEKVANNSVIGSENTLYSATSSRANFNSVTSVSRMCVKQGYTFSERLFAGNILLLSEDDVITYCQQHLQYADPRYKGLIEKYNLSIPSKDTVVEYFSSNLAKYKYRPDKERIGDYIDLLEPHERAFVYYAGCLINLCRENDTLFRSIFDQIMDYSKADPNTIDLKNLPKFDKALINMLLVTEYRLFGKDPETDKVRTFDESIRDCPEGAKKFMASVAHSTAMYEKYQDLFKVFITQNITVLNLHRAEQLGREVVPISDTDSNVFTTQNFVAWYCDGNMFSLKAEQASSQVVYLVTKAVRHYLGFLCRGCQVDEKDVMNIEMKNEFSIPVMVMSLIAKHYIMWSDNQEGKVLPEIRLDLKGVQLRNSAVPAFIRERFKSFLDFFYKELTEHGSVTPNSILAPAAELEMDLFNSLSAGDSTMLPNTSINNKEDYKIPKSSSYYYYELWQAVFAPTYGDMQIPGKAYKVNLHNGKRFLKTPAAIKIIQDADPEIYARLMRFLRETEKDELSYILIPQFFDKTPDLFLKLLDIRRTISDNMRSFYVFLESLGIATNSLENNSLVTDFVSTAEKRLEMIS